MFRLMIRGMAVGITETVPGVSGSTVAMILGIYERLIHSLSILSTNKRREAYPFLFIFGIGMVAGFTFALFLIKFLLDHYHTPTLIFFVGIIFGFLPYLGKELRELSKDKLQARHIIIIIIIILFLSLVIVAQLFGGMNHIDVNNLSLTDYLLFFTAGFIASIALVLPGISGALILTIFGIYEIAVESLIALNMPVVLSIGSGVVLGVLLTSKFIRHLLEKFKVETYAAMTGLVSGSIYAIMDNLDGVFDKQTIMHSLVTFFAGIAFLIILKEVQYDKSK